MKSKNSQKVKKEALVLTVGTGNPKDIEKTLFKPILKSIDDKSWDTVILFPSLKTAHYANEIISRRKSISIICEPLDAPELEVNADKCFGHFDSILGDLIDKGFEPANITLDFTRGTKAMSAALLMAGMSRKIPNIRYISGERNDQGGSVLPGTEKIVKINTLLVNEKQALNRVEDLMKIGNYEAVRSEIKSFLPHEPEEYLGILRAEFQEINYAARVYSAWERFNYKEAHDRIKKEQSLFSAGHFAPTAQMCNWLESLAAGFNRQESTEAANYVRRLVCDVLVNAERRMSDGLFEDAYIRSYRVLELIGQYSLFEEGYDSGRLPLDERIINFEKTKKKLKRVRHAGVEYAQADRHSSFRLLKHLGYSKWEELRDLGDENSLADNRNNSLLIHGFFAATTEQENNLKESIKDLKNFLENDFDEAREYLKVCESLKFF